ncbi:hypothetical protein HispidOSU_013022 [Sigmodon hispidus]
MEPDEVSFTRITHRCHSALHPRPCLELSSCRMPGHQLCEGHMRRLVLEDKPHNYPLLPENSIHVSDKPSWCELRQPTDTSEVDLVLLTSAALLPETEASMHY